MPVDKVPGDKGPVDKVPGDKVPGGRHAAWRRLHGLAWRFGKKHCVSGGGGACGNRMDPPPGVDVLKIRGCY
ncbi:MAG: hypothetical protein ACODAD_15740 [Planctomycetota bacterium]